MGVSDILREIEEGTSNGKEEDYSAQLLTTTNSSSSTNSSPSTRTLSSCPSITTILLNTISTSTSTSTFPRSSSFLEESSQRNEDLGSESTITTYNNNTEDTTTTTMTTTPIEMGLVAPAAESILENESLEIATSIITEDANLGVASSRTSSVGDKENQLVEWYNDKSEEDAVGMNTNAEMIEITPQTTEICTICIERITDYQISGCKHSFCSPCLREHFTTKVYEGVGVALGILCPDCHNEIAVSDLEALLSSDVLAKYRHFKKLATLRSDPYCRWCPKPDCDTPVIGNPYDADWPCLECTKCSTRFCYECNTRWHPKITCMKNVEMLKKKGQISLRDEKWKKKYSKKCPRCRTDIEKDAGCNHIVCTSCSFQFCWLCMEEYTPGHYETGACANKCFEPVDDDLDFIFGGRPRTPAQKVLRVGKLSLLTVGGVVAVGIAIPVGLAILPLYGIGWAIARAIK